MPKINYDFDTEPPPPASAGGRKLRIAVIFLAVAAVTGALIYCFRPLPLEEKRPPSVGAETPLPSGEIPAVPPEEELTVPATGSDPLPEPTDDSGETETETSEEETSSGSAAVREPEIEPVYTAEPEKDRPWIGDLRVTDEARRVDSELDSAASAETAAALARLRAELESGRFEAARDGALELLAPGKAAENSAPWREAAALLTEAEFRMMETGTLPKRGAATHTVRSGDSLGALARRHHVPIDGIAAYSRLESPDRIRVGETLKICPGPWRIRVEKSARLLKLYCENPDFPRLFAVFDIGIGRKNLTPSADFVISTRLRNPVWYAPDGGVYPYGDPGNVLGSRFLKLAPAGTPDKPLRGYGIHGTNREESVTRSESGGCIRMRNRDVERLFLLPPSGTPVEIVD